MQISLTDKGIDIAITHNELDIFVAALACYEMACARNIGEIKDGNGTLDTSLTMNLSDIFLRKAVKLGKQLLPYVITE